MSIPDPFRLRVLKALTSALEVIVPTGHTDDLTGKVFRGRDLFGDDDPVPMLSILEATQEKGLLTPPRGSTVYQGPWELLIQGFVDEDRLHPSDPAERLLADVRMALIKERLRDTDFNILGMEGKVSGLEISQGVVRPPDDISGKAYFWLRLTLTIVENLADPYS
jgi:hypothetical protein